MDLVCVVSGCDRPKRIILSQTSPCPVEKHEYEGWTQTVVVSTCGGTCKHCQSHARFDYCLVHLPKCKVCQITTAWKYGLCYQCDVDTPPEEKKKRLVFAREIEIK